MSHINESIKCTVSECAHHAQAKNYCSLDCITVGAHESCATTDQCTDCMSFKKK